MHSQTKPPPPIPFAESYPLTAESYYPPVSKSSKTRARTLDTLDTLPFPAAQPPFYRPSFSPNIRITPYPRGRASPPPPPQPPTLPIGNLNDQNTRERQCLIPPTKTPIQTLPHADIRPCVSPCSAPAWASSPSEPRSASCHSYPDSPSESPGSYSSAPAVNACGDGCDRWRNSSHTTGYC